MPTCTKLEPHPKRICPQPSNDDVRQQFAPNTLVQKTAALALRLPFQELLNRYRPIDGFLIIGSAVDHANQWQLLTSSKVGVHR